MKIVDSALCADCGSQETLRHLLVSCPSLRVFWSDVFAWWNSNSSRAVLFEEFKILYGYNAADPNFFLFNYFILNAKFHIFKQKLDAKPPALSALLAFLKEKVLIHRAIAIANQTLTTFRTGWTTLLSLLNN